MFSYRRATADDIELVRSIAKVAFPATYSTIISAEQIDYMMEWMYSAEKLQQEISGNITYLLAEVDGRTVGYLSFGPDESAADDDGAHCGKCASRCPYGLDTPALLQRNWEDYQNILNGKTII